MHMIEREGTGGQNTYSINERQLVEGGLSYSLCGDKNGSICYAE